MGCANVSCLGFNVYVLDFEFVVACVGVAYVGFL